MDTSRRPPPRSDDAPWVVLLNGRAVRAPRARALQARVDAWAQAHGLDGRLWVVTTAGAAEGTAAAAEAARAGAGALVAAGGDGTVRSVVAGLLQVGTCADDRPALAVAPLGRGNDLARSLGLGRGIDAGLACLREGHERHLDVGRAWVDGRLEVFVNALGLGLDAAIARRAKGVALPGAGAYGLAAVGAILGEHGPWRVTGSVDEDVIDREVTLLHVGNGATTGGGFRLTPRASPFDGRLDGCAVLRRRRRDLLALLPRVALGAHARLPGVALRRLRTLDVAIEPPAPVHGDGDVLAAGARTLRLAVQPAALRVRLPGRAADWYPPRRGTDPHDEPKHERP